MLAQHGIAGGLTMIHDDYAPKKDSGSNRKWPKKRTLLEHCPPGQRVIFVDGPPTIQIGQTTKEGPSDSGVVTMVLGIAWFVRFDVDGKTSEPLCVHPKSRVRAVGAN